MRFGLAALMVLVVGCENDVDLQGRIELGALVRLELPADEAVGSVGLIDGWVLILSYRDVPSPPPEWGTDAIDLYVRWLSPENVLGEPIYAGRALGSHPSPRWVRDGDALTGPLWATWDPDGPPGDARTYIRMASYRPGETMAACELTPELPVAVDPEQGALVLWADLPAAAGPEGLQPAAMDGSGVSAFAHYVPATCSPPLAVGGASLLSATAGGCAAAIRTLAFGDGCRRADPSDSGIATIWATEIDSATAGILYRPRDSSVPTRWLVPASGLPPITVGRLSHGTAGSGHQPRAAVVGETLLFSEAESYQQYCYLLRRAAVDGGGAEDAPWQLPCWRSRATVDFVEVPTRLHPFLDLHPVQAAVAAVFVDAPNPSVAEADLEVDVAAVVLTPDGRRGTELVDLESAEASAVAFVRTANDGDELVAIYFDEAAGREGYWLRRFAYVPDPR